MFGFFKRSPRDRRRKAGQEHAGDEDDVAAAAAARSEVMGERAPAAAAGAVRRAEPPKIAVKPCGHGTVAIAPHAAKRESAATPPSSPQPGPKKPLRPSDAPASKALNGATEDEKKNLINQEAKYQSQLNDLSKQLSIRDAEANKLRFQMEELQRDVFAKSAGMDRLQAELDAAHKESEIVKNRIRHLEHDLGDFREKNRQLVDELSDKSKYAKYESDTVAKIAELEELIVQLKTKIECLEIQLENLKKEKSQLEQQRAVLLAEREEEKKKMNEALEEALKQKQDIDKKWKEDFEKLRTINIVKEQQLLDDFEWKLREVQQSCKKKLEEKDKSMAERVHEACKEAEMKMEQAKEMMSQVKHLHSYETKIEELQGLTNDQEKALKEMVEQQEQMRMAEEGLKCEAKRLRKLIDVEKENLQHMQRKHHQELTDKERALKQTLHQKRIEIAMYWEERLLNECGRLKCELEQIHNEEKYHAIETTRQEKDEELAKAKEGWEVKVKEYLNEIAVLKQSLAEKDEYYHEEIVRTQTNTDRDLFELRRLMDKIDMDHHERFEKLVQEHDKKLEQITEESENKIREVEQHWQNQVSTLRSTLELVKEQMENESQQKIETLIEQHRKELDAQWDNLIRQKGEAVQLVEDEYVSKYKTLEQQFCTQQKSHAAREVELLKTIDTLKNELGSKSSTIDDLQSNCDTLEGGIQVLNNEIAQQNEQIGKNKKEANEKIRGLQETVVQLQEQQEKERENFRLKLMDVQKQHQQTVDHLQRKCQCLTKLFEEVRLRYERRDSRQEDLNIISDLKQVIAEQEKDLACLNEEKRYFQMRLMGLERRLEETASGDEEDAFQDAEQPSKGTEGPASNGLAPPMYALNNNTFSIPPTIPECDE